MAPPAPLLLLGACLASLLPGCTVGPDFKPPHVEAPGVWGPERTDVPSRTIATDVNATWWRTFNDPKLSLLVDRLVAQNLDLKTAAERVLQGRAQRHVVAAQGLPQLTEKSSYTYNRQSPAGFLSLVTPAPGAPLDYDIWTNAGNFSWELDLFGRVRRGVEAADAETLASINNRRGIALSALAELAQDYLQMRGVQTQLDIAEGNLHLAEQNSKLVRNRFANGVATTLETAQAQAQQATIASSLAPLRIQEAVLINAIGLLLAQPPRALEAELEPQAALPAVPPEVPVGLPGTLVRRRPDVLEAEARLHSATAQVGVAIANFYPDISLTGMADMEGRKVSNAFTFADFSAAVGPSISVPIFQGGHLVGTLRIRKSQQREAVLNFQKVVLQAWQDVDNALTAYAQDQRRHIDVAEAVRQNRAALAAARQRYTEGVADFLNVVSSETLLLQSQNDLVTLDVQITTDLVSLYRALGGGWEAAEPQPEPAAIPPGLVERLFSFPWDN